MKISLCKDNRDYELCVLTCKCLEELYDNKKLDIDMQEFDEKDPKICLVFGDVYDDGDYNSDGEWLSYVITDYKYLPIKYCPICGERINLKLNYQDKKVKTRRK